MSISTPELYDIFLESNGICIDSRTAKQGDLFFAIGGENFDGNDYALTALDKCSYAVVDKSDIVKGNRFLLVDDTLVRLQELATYHRERLGLPIIAITGTNGKTTTKELVARVMAKKYNVAYTKGNFNNHIGVPLTLLSFTREHEFGIVEMGANHIDEIALLCNIAKPNFGLITNVGKAHLEGFGSFDGVKKAKGELYHYLYENDGTAFVNYDNEQLEDMNPPHDVIYYGTGGFTHCQGRVYDAETMFLQLEWLKTEKGTSADPDWKNKASKINTQLIGAYNFENVLAAICIGQNFNVPEKEIIKAIEEYKPDNNRSQIVNTEHNTLILDGYNANPTSMKAAIANFAKVNAENKMVILGDMLELGRSSVPEHGVIVGLVDDCEFEKSIFVGTNFKSIENSSSTFLNDIEVLKIFLKKEEYRGFTILIKGSRGIKLELAKEFL